MKSPSSKFSRHQAYAHNSHCLTAYVRSLCASVCLCLLYSTQAAAQLELDRDVVDFGQVMVGYASAKESVSLLNRGSTPVELDCAGGGVGEPFDATNSCRSGTVLDSGTSCTIEYEFRPASEGLVETIVGPTCNGTRLNVTLRAEALAPDTSDFALEMDSLDFGKVAVGGSAPRKVKLINRGENGVSVTCNGGWPDGPYDAVTSCKTVRLAPEKSCDMDFLFLPSAEGVSESSYTYTCNGADYTIALRGEGVSSDNPLLAMDRSPAAFDFGEIKVGQGSVPQPISLVNQGTQPVALDCVSDTGRNFSGGSLGCLTANLPPGAKCQIWYSFHPQNVGPVQYDGELTCNGFTFAVGLSGEGLPERPYPDGAEVYGIVVNGEDRTPVSGIEVTVEGLEGVSDTTSGDGRYAIGPVPAGTYTMNFRKQTLRASAAVTIEESDTREQLDATVWSSEYTYIKGKVVDAETGEPLPGIDIEIQKSLAISYDPIGNTSTDSSGSYVARTPLHHFRARLKATDPDGSYMPQLRTVQNLSSGQVNEFDISMPLIPAGNVAVAGYVQDRRTERRIENAEVRFFQISGSGQDDAYSETLQTDATGRFEFRGAESPGEYHLSADHDAYHWAGIDMELPGVGAPLSILDFQWAGAAQEDQNDPQNLRVSLSPWAMFRGRVENEEGEPLEGILVEGYLGSATEHDDLAYGSTNGQGHYDLKARPWAGTSYRLYFSDLQQNHLPQWYGSGGSREFLKSPRANGTEVVVEGPGEIKSLDTVVMRRIEGWLHGTVTNEAGEPLEGIVVTAESVNLDNYEFWTDAVTTEPDGDFAIAVLFGEYSVRFSDPQGAYVPEWWEDSIAGGMTPITVSDDEPHQGPLDAQLTKVETDDDRVTVAGSVADELSGKGVPGVTVRFLSEDENGQWTTFDTAVSDVNGKVRTVIDRRDIRIQFDASGTGYKSEWYLDQTSAETAFTFHVASDPEHPYFKFDAKLTAAVDRESLPKLAKQQPEPDKGDAPVVPVPEGPTARPERDQPEGSDSPLESDDLCADVEMQPGCQVSGPSGPPAGSESPASPGAMPAPGTPGGAGPAMPPSGAPPEQPANEEPEPEPVSDPSSGPGEDKEPLADQPHPKPDPPLNPGGLGSAYGEVHMQTLDGAAYDLQAAGEFILARDESGEFEVQIRTAPWGTRNNISITTGAGVRIEGDVVNFTHGADPEVRVNGEGVEIADGESLSLPGGGAITRTRLGHQASWPDGTTFDVNRTLENYDTSLATSAAWSGKLMGLLGNANGDPADDFVTREGEALEPPLSFEILYPVFANSWRFEPDESLLFYADGESNEDFNLMWFPARAATLDAMQADDRSRAEAVCKEAGLSETITLEACIVDVGFTGLDSFAKGALRLQQRNEAAGIVPRLLADFFGAPLASFDAPDEVKTFSDFEVTWHGPNNRGDFIELVPLFLGREEEQKRFVGLATDTHQTRLGNPASMTVHWETGEYELRYRSSASGEWKTLGTRRLNVVAGIEPSLDAPSSVTSGAPFPVTWVGPNHGGDTVVLVRAGEPDDTVNIVTSQRVIAGNPLMFKAPAESGRYELRYIYGPARPVKVLARAAIEVE